MVKASAINEVFTQVETCLREFRPQLTRVAGKVAVEHKDDDTVVTAFDHEIEKRIRTILESITPDAGILGEEYGQQGDTSTFWTIDPIDGTEHFMRGDPFYVFMLGLVVEDEPMAALLYNYERDMLFKAQDGAATCNGDLIRVSGRDLSRAIVEVETNLEMTGAFDLIEAVSRASYCPQKPGACAGFGFTQVARGATEARMQINGYGKLFDYLPGQILVKMAGGVVQTPGQTDWDWRNLNSVASNQIVATGLGDIVADWSHRYGSE